MSDHPPYHVSSLAMMLFGLSAMLDTGEHDDITIEEVKRRASDGDLLDFLKTRAGGSFAMNLHEAHPGFARWYVAQIAENCGVMAGRERRKYGIERRGLCLLVSYTAEIIQQGDNLRLK
jgi:hypothetical protein